MLDILNKARIHKKWFLFSYSIISFCITIIYIVFNHTFFKVNWAKYNSDDSYKNKVDEILKHGVFWINGNLTSISSPLLICLFLLGAFFSLTIFFLTWRNLSTRTWTPIISFLGFLIPFIHSDGNFINLLILSFILILFGPISSVPSLRYF